MADATVAVRFAADLGDLVAGIGEARDALSSLAPSFVDLPFSVAELIQAFPAGAKAAGLRAAAATGATRAASPPSGKSTSTG